MLGAELQQEAHSMSMIVTVHWGAACPLDASSVVRDIRHEAELNFHAHVLQVAVASATRKVKAALALNHRGKDAVDHLLPKIRSF